MALYHPLNFLSLIFLVCSLSLSLSSFSFCFIAPFLVCTTNNNNNNNNSKARLLQRRAGPSEWPSVAVPRAACWPKWPSEAVFLQRRAGPSGLAVLAQVFRRCGLGLCWIRPSCASCEAQISCSGSNTIVTLTETLLCLRGGRKTAIITLAAVQLQRG